MVVQSITRLHSDGAADPWVGHAFPCGKMECSAELDWHGLCLQMCIGFSIVAGHAGFLIS